MGLYLELLGRRRARADDGRTYLMFTPPVSRCRNSRRRSALVVDRSAGKVERGGGLVIVLLSVRVVNADVGLFKPFDAEVESAHTGSRGGRLLTNANGQPVYGECVRHGR